MREAGVGVDIEMDIEVERKGSELFRELHEEPGRGRGGRVSVEDDATGRSSSEGGAIPSSVYSQSI